MLINMFPSNSRLQQVLARYTLDCCFFYFIQITWCTTSKFTQTWNSLFLWCPGGLGMFDRRSHNVPDSNPVEKPLHVIPHLSSDFLSPLYCPFPNKGTKIPHKKQVFLYFRLSRVYLNFYLSTLEVICVVGMVLTNTKHYVQNDYLLIHHIPQYHHFSTIGCD